MKILVTGSAGFIGSNVSKRLLKEGHQVIGIDNFNNYYDQNIKYKVSNELTKNPLFMEYRIDLEDTLAVSTIIQDEGFDCVIHLGAQAGVRHSIDNPQVYESSNIKGTLNIFESCRHYNVKKCIYASSSSVYGGLTTYPFKEDMNVDTPVSLYAATKKSCELMAYTYSHLYDISMIGLRFFTVYGPGGRPDMMLWKFTDAIMNDRSIDVYNNGNMERDFTFIDDIVDGIISCISLDKKCEIYNLGNNTSEKLLDVIKVIESKVGKKAIMNMMPIQDGDVVKTYADISKAQKDFNFNPTTSIDEGIEKFVEWFKKEI